jgi:hypothetical protein
MKILKGGYCFICHKNFEGYTVKHPCITKELNKCPGGIITDKARLKRLIGQTVLDCMSDLQERYDCLINLETGDIELLGTDDFYEQIMKNKVQYERSIR